MHSPPAVWHPPPRCLGTELNKVFVQTKSIRSSVNIPSGCLPTCVSLCLRGAEVCFPRSSAPCQPLPLAWHPKNKPRSKSEPTPHTVRGHSSFLHQTWARCGFWRCVQHTVFCVYSWLGPSPVLRFQRQLKHSVCHSEISGSGGNK